MANNVRKLIRNYWNISKIVAVLLTIWNYEMWTQPFNFIKAIVLIIGGSAVMFLAINLLDMTVGFIKMVCQKVYRHFYQKRLLKDFCQQKEKV